MKKIALRACGAVCCFGFAMSASAFDLGPTYPTDTASALTNFTSDGQSGTWLGSVNGFIATSNDPGLSDPSDQWTFTIGSDLVGSLNFQARSGQVTPQALVVYTGKYAIDLNGPVTGSGTGMVPGTLSGLTPGNYTVTITNQATYPDVGGYAFTVSVAAAPAVPEPATWALMVGGLGAVGFGARRRRGA